MRRTKFDILGVFLLIAVSGCGMPTRTCVAKGNKEFKNGNFEESVKKFEDAKKRAPDSDIVNYDLGTAHYKNGDYKSAEENLQNALLTDDQPLKEKAHYNLGNTFFQSGMVQKDKDAKAAIGELEKATEQYESALAIDDKDDQAKNNLDVTRKKIEELKKFLQQQKQQQQQQKDKDQKDQQGSSSGKDNPQDSQQNSQKGQSGQSQSDDEKDDQGKISAQNGDQGESDDNQEQGAVVGSEEDMNQKEAERLLRSYQEKEEPKGLPNFMRGSGNEKPVEKDW